MSELAEQLQQRAFAEPGVVPVDSSGRELADWTVRVVATSIDVIVLTVVQGGLRGMHLGGVALFLFDWVIVASYLCVIAWKGVTLGNLLTKTKVVDASSGEVLSLRRAFLRSASLLGLLVTLVGAGIDVLFPLIDARRQTLHDKVGNALVVRTGRIFPVPPVTPVGENDGH